VIKNKFEYKKTEVCAISQISQKKKTMASNRLVWFLLVDGEGQALTTASKVRILSNGDVDDFRDAVKEKYADSHLKGIAPSDLVVYANRVDFEAGNAVEEDEQIGNRGDRKANALVVVVPATRQSTAEGARTVTTRYPVGVHDEKSALLPYFTIAQNLVGREEVTVLVHVIQIVYGIIKDGTGAPFVILENSSGTGKTQMAFSLMQHTDLEVFYVVCAKTGEMSQRIQDVYTAF
jgi:hypothetical protein